MGLKLQVVGRVGLSIYSMLVLLAIFAPCKVVTDFFDRMYCYKVNVTEILVVPEVLHNLNLVINFWVESSIIPDLRNGSYCSDTEIIFIHRHIYAELEKLL